MTHRSRLALIAIATILPPLSGCVVSTAAKVATAPVRVASKGVDMMTTSQSEADRKRGRDLRHREEKRGQLEREYNRHNAECLHGDEEACEKARLDYGEIQDLQPSAPAPQR
jgi:hypothetical protein